MTTLGQLEIQREDETSTLFRAASLMTTLMDLYMKSVCQDFLHTALFPTIHRILESRQSCELNPSKIESPTEACANAEFLLQVEESKNIEQTKYIVHDDFILDS